MPAITENFEAVEQAVLESPRGRWFLAEYSSRLRARETTAVVDQVKSLEAAVSANHDAIMSRLAQALGQQATGLGALHAGQAPASPAPDLAPKHMKFFKQDEEIFEAAPQATIAVVKPAAPQPEHKGAKLTITRVTGPSAAAETPTAQVEPPAPVVEPKAVEPPVAAAPELAAEAPPKRRIVIIRHKPGEEIDVPLQNEMQATG